MLMKYLNHCVSKRGIATFSFPNLFRVTANLYAEPLKKKKRLDPAVIKQREERKKRRIEKQIRRLERNVQQLKPIAECETPMEIISHPQLHNRNILEPSHMANSTVLFKKWTKYKNKQHLKDIIMIERILQSQTIALENLNLTSPILHDAAFQADTDFIPWKATGPVETPPLEGFDSPDGEYIDISKKWDNI